MGNCCEVHGAVDHWVYIKVGDRKLPPTDARLRLIAHDVTGRSSGEIKMDIGVKSKFERGTNEVFEVGGPMYSRSDLLLHSSRVALRPPVGRHGRTMIACDV